MFLPLFLLFITVPFIEVYLLLKVGSIIGGTNTFLIIIVTGVLGAYYTKAQGRYILRKIQNKISQNQMPEKELVYGVMLFIGGIFLITPGFLTDFIGLALIVPISRDLIFLLFIKNLKNNIKFQTNIYTNDFRQQNDYQYKRSNEEIEPNVFEAEFETKEEKNL